MRRFHLALLLSLSTLPPLAWSPPARAQVSDAERAAARDLFKQGDELQRAGKFPEALDKFQRAEQVIHAPTNILRIAECQAAMGRLVEAAESYRQVTHFQLSPTSPPAFQSAIDQAKGELAQVEPRVPKVTVQVTPPPAQGSQPELVIDGASVPFALVGEQIPLDPGTHTLQAKAAGYASQTETVSLKERDTKTVALKLEPAQGGATVVAPPPAGGGAPPPPPPPYGSTASPGTPPPPPPVVMESAPQAVRPRSNVGILIGAHLGAVATSGKIDTNTGTQNLNDLAAGGLGIGLDGGLRFARHWYVGVQYDHTTYSPSTTNNNQFNGYSSHSDTFGLDFAFIVNPDRVSFYGTLGLQTRIYTLAIPGLNTDTFTSGEFLAGAGIWIPLGHWFRLLPELTGGFGNFNVPTDATGTGEGHAFFTLGLVGYYNVDL
ncbi:MAG TPA: hypothetical protein VF765_05730 [Polyangiaceae bacterium]